MDTTALTNAWLSAVYRTRSAAYQHFIQEVPKAKPSRADRTLSDAIEAGLQDAGARPLPAVNETRTVSASKVTSTQHVDRLV